jgi:aryl-alcohol dehydrogenase-like predicted oxidoreductase
VSTVITGATSPAQVEENMQALDLVDQIDEDVNTRIETILDNQPKSLPNYRRS